MGQSAKLILERKNRRSKLERISREAWPVKMHEEIREAAAMQRGEALHTRGCEVKLLLLCSSLLSS